MSDQGDQAPREDPPGASRSRLVLTFTERGLGGRFGGLSATAGAGAIVQVASTAAALVTVAVLVRYLGAAQFGILVVVVALTPWLLLADGALYPTTRLLAGESRSRTTFVIPRSLVVTASRLAALLALVVVTAVGLAVCLLPLAWLFGGSVTVTEGEIRAAVLVFAVPVVLSGPGGVSFGALEAVGRTVVSSLLWGCGPLLALPLTFVVVLLDGGLVGACAAQGLGVAAPRLTAWLYWYWRPSVHDDDRHASAAIRAIRPVALQMLVISATILVATGVDPMIVSARLGAEAAAEFGFVARIAGGALIPLTVITPLLASNISSARAAGWGPGRDRDLRRLCTQMTLVGAVLAGSLLLVGPPLVHVLAGEHVTPPFSLYAGAAAVVWTTVLATPLMLAFSGPRGLRRSTTLSIVLALVNVTATWFLVASVGVSGPLWATSAAALLTWAHWQIMWRVRPDWLQEVHPSEARA